jgi:peptide/nickel transport system substrate-binding protein
MSRRDEEGRQRESHQEAEAVKSLLDEYADRPMDRGLFFKRASALGISLGVAGSIFAACGGDDDAAAPAPAEPVEPAPAPAPAPAEPVEPAPAPAPAEPAPAEPAETGPTRGGRLRIGVLGGGASESLDPNFAINEVDVPRVLNLYDGLTELDPDGNVRPHLLEEWSSNDDATVWTLKMRDGVVFHDGSPLTTDDIVYSLRYVADPANESTGQESITFVQPNNIRRLDATTVELTLDQPFAFLPNPLAERFIKIVKDGTTEFEPPNGTGPFKFESWTRGERSLFSRNENYWIEDRPYLDELEVFSIEDPSARLNALVSGQIDAMAQLDFKQYPIAEADANLTIIEKASGASTPLYMSADHPPFDDNRVREAFRLMTDRQQMIDQVLDGHGRIGNDLFGWFDPDYNAEIPQREYDPERATALLADAGQEGLEVTLHISEVAPGLVDSATLFAEQAKAAGVTVELMQYPPDQYWTGPWLNVPFAGTDWPGRPIVDTLLLAVTSDGPYNETAWRRPEFDALLSQALATPDADQRKPLMDEVQQQLWDEGGYLIWGFKDLVDVAANNVKGITPSVVRPLGYYNFRDTYLEG